MSQATPDTEFTLTHDAYALTVSPYGASLRGLTYQGRPVITGYHGAAGKVAAQGDVQIPFPGRVRGGPIRPKGAAAVLYLRCGVRACPDLAGVRKTKPRPAACLAADGGVARARPTSQPSGYSPVVRFRSGLT